MEAKYHKSVVQFNISTFGSGLRGAVGGGFKQRSPGLSRPGQNIARVCAVALAAAAVAVAPALAAAALRGL